MPDLRAFIIDPDIEELEAMRYWLELDPELDVTTYSDEVDALRTIIRIPPEIIFLGSKAGDPKSLILCELLRSSPELNAKTMIIGMMSESDAQSTHIPARLIEAGASRVLFKPIDQSTTHHELKEIYRTHIRDGWLAQEIAEFNERKDSVTLSRRLFVDYMEAWRLSQSIASIKPIVAANAEIEAVAGRLGIPILLFIHRMIATLPANLQALDDSSPQQPDLWQHNLDEVALVIRSIQMLIQNTINTFEKTSEKIDLVELLNQSVHKHRDQAQAAGVQITSPSLRGAIYIRGVPDQLLRLFHYIITNSIESMFRGGVLSIEPGNTNKNITIEFVDTGEGFSDLQKAGTLGYSTKMGRQGTGLFFCKRIAEQHHAELIFRNRAGQQGAKVTLIFPNTSIRPNSNPRKAANSTND